MKVLLVGSYNDTSDNIGQYRALTTLGYDTVMFDYKRYPGDVLVKTVERDRPDLVILNKCQHYSTDVIDKCRNISRVVYWYMDPVVSMKACVDILGKVKACHAAAASRRGVVEKFRQVNPVSCHIHEGFDPFFHKPMADVMWDVDVSFIGQIRAERENYYKNVKFTVISDAYNEKHSMAVCRSKINLNFSEGCGSSNRIYKLMASGGFVLTQKFDGLEDDFKVGEELVAFNNIEDLREKIDYYLHNDNLRQHIAFNGLKAVQKYSWATWAGKIVLL
ncbi:MAG: glycosyltransferase [Lentisphaerota bacterium]